MPYPTTGNQPLFVVVSRTLAFVQLSIAVGWTPPPNASALTAAYLHTSTTTRTTHVPWMWWLCAKPATSLGIAEATTDVDHSLVPRSFTTPSLTPWRSSRALGFLTCRPVNGAFNSHPDRACFANPRTRPVAGQALNGYRHRIQSLQAHQS